MIWYAGDGDSLPDGTSALVLAAQNGNWELIMTDAAVGIAVFLGFASMFDSTAPIVPYDGAQNSVGYLRTSYGVACYIITIALLATALLMVYRHRPAPGAATATTLIVAIFPMVVREFPQPQTAAVLSHPDPRQAPQEAPQEAP